jgi:hypothetical protein
MPNQRPGVAVSVSLCNTLLFLAALFWLRPFERANRLLDDVFGAPPEWTDVTNLFTDPDTQEVTHGDHPRASFEHLATYWASHPGFRHIVFIGNSQMHAMTLAPGEARPTEPEKTYPDLIPRKSGASAESLVYRLSAGGLSYTEALWYVEYLLSRPDLKPDVIVLQINYQAFWQAGIRDGLLELLRLPAFRRRVEAIACEKQPFSDTFQEALNRSATMQMANASTGQAPPNSPFADLLENRIRGLLSKTPGFSERHNVKDTFLEMLYRGRLYFLRLKPSTPRSITGVRLIRSQAAVEEIARRCQESSVRLILFHAPLNPAVKLYRTPLDRKSHYAWIRGLATRYQLSVFDLENAIPAEDWGRLLNGPDPLHMGRKAHHEMAQRMAEILANRGENTH